MNEPVYPAAPSPTTYPQFLPSSGLGQDRDLSSQNLPLPLDRPSHTCCAQGLVPTAETP